MLHFNGSLAHLLLVLNSYMMFMIFSCLYYFPELTWSMSSCPKISRNGSSFEILHFLPHFQFDDESTLYYMKYELFFCA